MAEPVRPPPSAPLNTRVPPALLPELDRIAAELSVPGRVVTRSDVVRELLLEGVAKRRAA